jgi:hypothetical protein
MNAVAADPSIDNRWYSCMPHQACLVCLWSCELSKHVGVPSAEDSHRSTSQPSENYRFLLYMGRLQTDMPFATCHFSPDNGLKLKTLKYIQKNKAFGTTASRPLKIETLSLRLKKILRKGYYQPVSAHARAV